MIFYEYYKATWILVFICFILNLKQCKPITTWPTTFTLIFDSMKQTTNILETSHGRRCVYTSIFFFFSLKNAKPLASKHSWLYIILKKNPQSSTTYIALMDSIPKFPKKNKKTHLWVFLWSDACRSSFVMERCQQWFQSGSPSTWQPSSMSRWRLVLLVFPMESVSQWSNDQPVHEDEERLSMASWFYNSGGAH